MTPALLHLSPYSLASLRSVPPFVLRVLVRLSRVISVRQVCVLGVATLYFRRMYSCAPYSCSLARSLVIMTNNLFLSESFIKIIPPLLYVGVFAVCLSRQKAGRAQAITSPTFHSPQGNSFHQPGKPDFQVSHPHPLDCSPLTCANIKDRDGEWKRVKWKDIPAFGYWVGRRKEYRTAEQTSVPIGLHLYTLLSLCSLLIHSLCV